MKILITIFIVLTFMACHKTPVKIQDLPQNVPTNSVEQKKHIEALLKDIDKLYLQHNIESLNNSIAKAKEIIDLNPYCSDAYWRISRAYHSLYDLTESEEQKNSFSLEGIKYAQQGMKANPKSAACLYYQAVSLGLYSKLHTLTSLGRIQQMIESAKEAITIDESFSNAGPHRLLGYVYLQAPETLGIGDLDLALEHFEKARKIAPNYAGNLVAMAQAYIEDDLIEEAEELLKEVLSRTDFVDMPHALEQSKQEAQELLDTL